MLDGFDGGAWQFFTDPWIDFVLGKSRLISLSNVCLGPQVSSILSFKVQFRVSVWGRREVSVAFRSCNSAVRLGYVKCNVFTSSLQRRLVQ